MTEQSRVLSISRADVVALLAGYGDRPLSAVGDTIDSLELAWLLHQVEQRYSVTLDPTDDELVNMSTMEGAVATLNVLIAVRR